MRCLLNRPIESEEQRVGRDATVMIQVEGMHVIVAEDAYHAS